MDPKTTQVAHQLKAELKSAEEILGRQSENDSTFRAMLAELFHSEQVQTAVRGWLPKAIQQVDALAEQATATIAEKNARIAELERELAAARVTPVVDVESVAAPVDDITGWKRPPLHEVTNETA